MQDIIEKLKQFRDERDWNQFHTPENLAKSVVLESAELLENFQWGSQHADKENIKEELADIVGYALLMCDHYGFDLKEILNEKIKKNNAKYPVNKSYGTSKKYNKL